MSLVLAFLLFTVAAMALGLATLGRRRSAVPGARAFSALCLALAVWSAAYGADFLTDGLRAKVWLSKVQYLGIAPLSPAFLLAVLAYTGRRDRVARRWPVLFAVPVATILVVWTNELHHLHWSRTSLAHTGGLAAFKAEYGPWFWVQAVYSYGCLGLASVLLIRTLWSSAHYRRQLRLLVPAILAPWLANLAYISGAVQIVDPTPFAFAISTIAVAYCMFRFRVLDIFAGLVPAGRNAMIDVMEEAVVVVDDSGRVVDANPAAATLAGRRHDEIVGMEAAKTLPDWPDAVVRPGGPVPAVGQLSLDQAGVTRHYEYSVRHLEASGLVVGGRMVVIRDVTLRTVAERAMRSSEERYRDLIENASDVVFTATMDGKISSVNRAGERILGYPRHEIVGRDVAELLVDGGNAERRSRLMGEIAAGREIMTDLDVLTGGGREVAFEVRARPMRTDGVVTGLQGIARDVTERRSWEARLEREALHDSLTDLPNRALFRDRLNQAVALGGRTNGRFAALMMDLDRFKDINDTLGHSVGDLLLREIGPRLRPILREADTLARVGGDEFAILLPDITREGAAEIAGRLLQSLEQPFPLVGREISVGASIGIAMFPDHGSAAEALLRHADIAMYSAKRRGAGVTTYDHATDEAGIDRLALAEDLRRAIERDELTLHYQPVLDVATGRPIAAEALVRWQHPTHGLLAPDRFVPLAEHVGLIAALSRWVTRTATGDCAAWRASGHQVEVAINLSPLNLTEPELHEVITAAAAANGLPLGALRLELTEGAVMRDQHRGAAMLRQLRAAGIAVAIDDFGTGFSSLGQLQALPVDEIKVDRSFIRDCVHNPGDAAIVRAIVSLAHDLGLVAVAEGVESAETLDFLAEIGCDRAQGYFICAPLAQADFLTWLGTQSPANPSQVASTREGTPKR